MLGFDLFDALVEFAGFAFGGDVGEPVGSVEHHDASEAVTHEAVLGVDRIEHFLSVIVNRPGDFVADIHAAGELCRRVLGDFGAVDRQLVVSLGEPGDFQAVPVEILQVVEIRQQRDPIFMNRQRQRFVESIELHFIDSDLGVRDRAGLSLRGLRRGVERHVADERGSFQSGEDRVSHHQTATG